MSTYNLTPHVESRKDIFDGRTADNMTTVDLLEYGLRDGCTDAEYHLANRLHKLRRIALELIEVLDEEGLSIDLNYLHLIDTEIEVTGKKRLTL